jgi:nicotinate-nucleotide--dimethylbenzimidazole phosphoribosyltransferase
MTRAEATTALEAGVALAGSLIADGIDLIGLGEMGIGNSTSASALTAALLGLPAAEVTGRGTGIDDAALERKIALIERALATNEPDPADPLGVLASVGGLEIAALVGVIAGAGAAHVPVILDGFITGAAALVASALEPKASGCMVAATRSPEPGHGLVLGRLELEPLLELELRLGEGSGAALALPLFSAALAVLDEMATFAEAGVTDAGR